MLIGIILGSSVVALVRLHATGGYLTVRHALIPGMILTMAAGAGLCWLTSKVAIPGRWLGLAHERFRLGPAAWVMLIAPLVIFPIDSFAGPVLTRDRLRSTTRPVTGLRANTRPGEKVLDLTDWSLFFSRRGGYRFADVYKAPADAQMRWIVVRTPRVDGQWHYSTVIRELLSGKAAVAQLPAQAAPGELQISIYDRQSPAPLAAATEFNPPRTKPSAALGSDTSALDTQQLRGLTDESLDLDLEIREEPEPLDHAAALRACRVCSWRWRRHCSAGAIRHTETSFADGLRYIHQAERIEAGSWREAALQAPTILCIRS